MCAKIKGTPSDTDETVWKKTLDEVRKGWLQGPFEPADIPSPYPLRRRFGVVQGEKTRCVDDFSRSHVNSCVQVTEAPKPQVPKVFNMLALPFGSIKGSWLHVPLTFCGPTTSMTLYAVAQMTVHAFFHILG